MALIKQRQLNPKVKSLVEDLKKYRPSRIILFGSYARGNPKEDSDVDLLLIKKTSKKRLERTREVIQFLSHSIPADVFVLTPEEFSQTRKEPNYFMREILKYGKIIH